MPNDKKFLNANGVSYLWSQIATELNKKGQVDSIQTDDSLVVATSGTGITGASPKLTVQLSSAAGNILELKTTSGSEGLYVPTPASAPVYSLTKDATSTEYAAVYHLTKDGTNEGVAINIPKDMVVSSGSVVTKNTTGAWGSAGTYIELTLSNATNDKLYIAVDDLIEYVTSGSSNGDMVVISIDGNHQVTASISDGTITKAKLTSSVQASLDKADSALQSHQAVSLESGTNNGTLKLTVGETATDNIAVTGLGSAAYTASTAYDAAGEATAVYNAIIGLSNDDIDTAIAAATTQVS